ncbi:MAG: hypothetical protein GF364_14410 [Candidatus Lokiarchaeota archaeon]|nr:hypothetical protein [Candidatus Lokiarchaeota archaeon]
MLSKLDITTQLLKIGLTKSEVKEKLERIAEYSDDLITGDDALYVLSKQMGIDFLNPNNELFAQDCIKIEDISQDNSYASFYGRVAYYIPPKEFDRSEDGAKGHYSVIWLYDSTNEIKVLLWDDKASYTAKKAFKINKLVKILNGKVKFNNDNIPEIHIGHMGDIDFLPTDVNSIEFPKKPIKSQIVNIGDLNTQTYSLSVQGTIMLKQEVYNFEQGALQKINLKDNTGKVDIIFWNDDRYELNKSDEGDVVFIKDLYLKQNQRTSKLELHSKNTTVVKVILKDPRSDAEKFTPINFAANKEQLINIQGIIIEKQPLRTIQRPSREDTYLFKLRLSDKTGTIIVNFWDKLAQEYEELNVGDIISLYKVSSRFNDYSEEFEITFKYFSRLKKEEDI